MKFLARILALAGIFCASSAFAMTPKTGFWVNHGDGGTGYNMEINGDVMVLAIYTYDASGSPLWYLSSNLLTQNGTYYEGTLDKYRNGQCLTCAYSEEQLVGNDGVIRIKFTSETTAQVTLPDGSSKALEWFFRGEGGDEPDGDGLPMTWQGIEMQKLSYREVISGICVATLTYRNTTSTSKIPFLTFDAINADGVKIGETGFHVMALDAGMTAVTEAPAVVHPCNSFTLRFNAASSSVYDR